MANTIVIFRKLKETGEIVALFPLLKTKIKDNVLAFSVKEKSIELPYTDTIKNSVLATEEEYNDTKVALETIGYSLNIKSRKPNPKRVNEKLISSITSWVYDIIKQEITNEECTVHEETIRGLTVEIDRCIIPDSNHFGFVVSFDEGVGFILAYTDNWINEHDDTSLLASLTQGIKHAVYGR